MACGSRTYRRAGVTRIEDAMDGAHAAEGVRGDDQAPPATVTVDGFTTGANEARADWPETAARSGPALADPEAGTRRRSARVRLRLARDTEADFRAGLALARELHDQTLFREMAFSETKARALFRRALTRPDRAGLIYAEAPDLAATRSAPGASDDVVLAGFAFVQAGEYFLSEGDLVATVLTLNVTRNLVRTPLGGRVALRLVAAMRRWAEARACQHLFVHATGGIDPARADHFFRRCGFKVIGGNYVSSL